jgi:hypothetical protein
MQSKEKNRTLSIMMQLKGDWQVFGIPNPMGILESNRNPGNPMNIQGILKLDV